jgi:hypothetical protein
VELITGVAGSSSRPVPRIVLQTAGLGRSPEGFRQPRSDVAVLRPAVSHDRAHLDQIVALLDAGAVFPPPIVRYDLANAAEARRVSEARHFRGNLALAVC